MSDYEHDIFLSYRRLNTDWVRWTELLADTLRTLLCPSMGNAKIFVDTTIESGASWPLHLAKSLARSKILLCVLSRQYFESDWCRLEIALMFHREQEAGFRTLENPSRLIVPVVIDDGDSFPNEIQELSCKLMHQFSNPYLVKGSETQFELAEFIRIELCPVIESALRSVPEFDPSWENFSLAHFSDRFRIQASTQKRLPSIQLPVIL